MSRVQAAVERLYESTNVRDELTDDEAEALLKWAEAELARLDSAELDDDAYAAQVDTLLGLLKQINRFAGRQGQAAAQAVEQPAKIAELATALGHSTPPEQIASAGTGDPAGTITALTALLSAPDQGAQAAATSAKAGAKSASASPPPPVADQPPSAPLPPDSPDQPSTDSPDQLPALLPSGDDPVDEQT